MKAERMLVARRGKLGLAVLAGGLLGLAAQAGVVVNQSGGDPSNVGYLQARYRAAYVTNPNRDWQMGIHHGNTQHVQGTCAYVPGNYLSENSTDGNTYGQTWVSGQPTPFSVTYSAATGAFDLTYTHPITGVVHTQSWANASLSTSIINTNLPIDQILVNVKLTGSGTSVHLTNLELSSSAGSANLADMLLDAPAIVTQSVSVTSGVFGDFTLAGSITPSWTNEIKDFFIVRVIARGEMTLDSLSASNDFRSVIDDGTGGTPFLFAPANRDGDASVSLDAAWSKAWPYGGSNVARAVRWRVVDSGGAVHASGDFLGKPAIASLAGVGGKQRFLQAGLDANANAVLDDAEVLRNIALNFVGVDIKAQGLDSGVTLSATQPLSVTLDVRAGDAAGYGADWWCLAHEANSDTWSFYVSGYSGVSWAPWDGSVSYQAPLRDVVAWPAVGGVPIPAGNWTFYFGVDLIRNGAFDLDWLVYDQVDVTVTP